MHKIEPTCKKVGAYPQIQKIPADYDRMSPNSIDKLPRYQEEFPDFRPDFPILPLEKKAKTTDMLSCAYLNSLRGWLISAKFSQILANFKSVPYKVYPVSVCIKNEIVTYYWHHFITPNFAKELVVFNKTKFTVVGTDEEKYFTSFIDYENYRNKLRKSEHVRFLKCTFLAVDKSKFDFSYDIFTFGIKSGFYISDKLRSELISQKITGIDILPADDLIFV
jgi:hypothetical protein